MEKLKISGSVLILLGLIIIFWTLGHTYYILMGSSQVPNIFKIENYQTATSSLQSMSGQIKEMLPSDLIAKFFNLAGWMIIAGIFLFGGAQISALGVNLYKK